VFAVDDAYITRENVRVLVGGPSSYPGASHLTGATSPVHLAIVGLFALVLPVLEAQYLVGWLAAAALASGLVRIGRVHRLPGWLSALVAIACLVAAEVPHQLLNGLETGLAMACVAWGIALASEQPARRRAVWMLSGLMPFVRPDLAVVSLALLVLTSFGAPAPGTGVARFVRAGGVAFLAALPWMVWLFVETGSPVPATAGAKALFFAESTRPLGDRLHTVALALAIWGRLLFPIALVVLLLPLTRTGLALVAAFVAFLSAYLVYLPGALWHYEHRYLYVFVPLLALALAAAYRDAGAGRSGAWIRRALIALVGLSLASSLQLAERRWRQHRDRVRFTEVELEGVAAWARLNVPAHSRVMVHDAGYFGWATPFELIDIVGLKTTNNAAVHRALTGPSGGARRGEAVHRIASRWQPAYFVELDGWGDFRMAEALRERGWVAEAVRDTGAYRVYRLTPPVRRSAPA
jgi:hypothetical protein